MVFVLVFTFLIFNVQYCPRVTLHLSKGHCRGSENIYVLVILQEMTASVSVGSFPAGLSLLDSEPSIQTAAAFPRSAVCKGSLPNPPPPKREPREGPVGCLRAFAFGQENWPL